MAHDPPKAAASGTSTPARRHILGLHPRIKGRKRHIVVDTIGLLVGLVVHAADIQDRDSAPAVLETILQRRPWLRHVFADGGYAGPKLKGALQRIGSFSVEIVKR